VTGQHVKGAERDRLTRSAALASSGMALFLVGLKGWAAWASGSVAMLGSLADTLLDLAASLVTLYAVGLAATPADEEHRFGHGKAEAIAALMQTLLILASAAAVLFRAVTVLLGTADAVAAPELGISVSLVCIVTTLLLVWWQGKVVARTGSVAIATDRLHYQSDLVLNLAVIAALGLEAWAGLHGADAVLGIGIAVWIGRSAVQSARHAIDMLMDREWPEARRQGLLTTVRACPGVLGAHDLKTRTSGATEFIQFHIWLPPEMTVAEAHGIVDCVEATVLAAHAGAEVLVHVDPHGHFDDKPRPGSAALPPVAVTLHEER
jgi:ferrous-iron efflux pump FieF